MNRVVSGIDLKDSARVWRDPKAKCVSFFSRCLPVRVDQQLIREIRLLAASLGNQNVRVCLHDNPHAEFHEMIIVEHPTKYYRPHKHKRKGESYHLIEGSMGVFVFDGKGTIMDTCRLSVDSCLIYRVGADMYHAVMPLTDTVIYHESKPGPFTGEGDSIYPTWAPDGSHPGQVMKYQKQLLKALGLS